MLCYDSLKSQDLEIVRAIFDFFLVEKQSLSNCSYCVNRAQSLSGPAPTFGSHCSRFRLNWFTFSRGIAEHAKTIFARRVFPI